MIRPWAIIACVSVSAHAQAAEPLPGPVPAELVRVIDGDTIQVRALIWPGHTVETRVRVRGIDTPETRRPDCEAEREAGQAATAFTEAWLTRDPAEAGLSLYEIDLGSFAGRVVAAIQRDGEDLAAALVSAGLAVRYGEEGPWCSSHEGATEDAN